MKKLLFAILFSSFSLSTVALAGDDAFPKIGASYRVIYAQKPDGYFWPIEVKVLERGTGLWCLVEYTRDQFTTSSRRVIRSSADAKPPEPEPTPAVPISSLGVTEKRWMNFALLLSAQESKTD